MVQVLAREKGAESQVLVCIVEVVYSEDVGGF